MNDARLTRGVLLFVGFELMDFLGLFYLLNFLG
jgi:hypothetical protein